MIQFEILCQIAAVAATSLWYYVQKHLIHISKGKTISMSYVYSMCVNVCASVCVCVGVGVCVCVF